MVKKMMVLTVIAIMGVVMMGGSCAGVEEPVVTEVLPVEAEVAFVEILHTGKEAVALRLGLELYNPNDALANVDTLTYSVYVDVGSEQITLLNGQYFGAYIPAKTSVILKDASAVAATTLVGTYLMKMAQPVPEAAAGVGALFTDIAKGNVVYNVYVDVTTVLPDYPGLDAKVVTYNLESK